MTVEEINNIPFFFIVGKGRSGTTLLQTILDANRSVILPLESPLIIHLKHKYFKTKKWTNKKIDALILDLYKDVKFINLWHMDKEKLRNDLYALPQINRNFALICRQIYSEYPSIFIKKDIKIIGDKNPKYSIFIKELLEIFPDAKFIHLVRDYRSNVASNKKFFHVENVATLAYNWGTYNRIIEKEKEKRPSAFYTLKYENFVAKPKQYTKEICNFLNIEFSLEMLQFHKKTPQYFKATRPVFEMVHSHLSEPINTNNIETWKKNLTEKEQKIIDYVVGDYAERYGYQKMHHEKNIRLFFILLIRVIRQPIDISITRTYYKLPFFIRSCLGFIPKVMYRHFGYRNYYSDEVFREKYKTKK